MDRVMKLSKGHGLIRVGVIGTGGVGEKLLRTFHHHPDTQVRAICDVNEERMAQLSQEFGEFNLNFESNTA